MIERNYSAFVSLLLGIGLVFSLSACVENPDEFTPTGTIIADTSAPDPTITPTITLTQTETPTSLPTDTPTWTPLPTVTLTPTTTLLVLEQTPITPNLPVITVENAWATSAIAEWVVDGMTDFEWTPDASSLAVATPDRIEIFDILTRENWRSLYPQIEGIRQIEFSPGGNWLVSSSYTGTEETGYTTSLEQWYGIDLKPLGVFGVVELGLSDMEFSSNGLTLVTAFSTIVEDESSVDFWDVSNWSINKTLRVGSVLDLSISNFGQRMATSPHRYGISMWNLEDPVSMVFRNPTAFTSAITTAQFSPDGSLLATAHYDGSARIWNAFDGTLIRTMSTDSVVESLAFSPDGSLLATSSSFDDYLVRIWRVDNGDLLRTLGGHSAGVDHLLFSPFGDLIVSGSYDGQIIVWGIRP